MASIELLGGFQMRVGGAPVLLPRKAAALVAQMALAGDRPLPRERLAAMLWEDSAEPQARASLRQALAAVRRAAPGEPVILDDPAGLRLDFRHVVVDVMAFERLVAGSPEERAQAIALFHGDLLADFPAPGAQWSAWVEGERSRLRGMAVSAMDAHGSVALAERRIDEALVVAARLVALEPWHEPGHRLMMEALALAGRSSEALRHYRRLQEQLRRELQVPPEPETVALAAQLGARRRQATGAGSAALAEAEDARDEVGEEETGGEPASAPASFTQPTRQLRRLVALAAALDGHASDTNLLALEALPALLTDWREAATRVVQAAGGDVYAWMGNQMLATFGRHLARIDDPRRAADCALALHRRARDLAVPPFGGLQVRIGLAVGGALVDGTHGPDSVVGQVLTDAQALLNRAAPGAILADAAMEPELGPRFAASAAGDGAIALLAEGNPVSRGQPLSGRAGELAQLEALAAAARSGTGLVIVLAGEAGIGKTRLVTALRDRLTAAGWEAHGAHIVEELDGAAAVTPRRMISRSLLGLQGSEGGTIDSLPRARTVPRVILPWLRQIAGAEAPSAAGASQDAQRDLPESGRAEAFAALLGLACVERPQLLVVEDAHWAGATTRLQLAELAEAVRRCRALLLVTSRPAEDRQANAWQDRAGPTLTMELGRMTTPDLAAMASALGIADRDLAQRCAARADGNPLFLRQLVTAVRAGEDPEQALPGSVASLVQGRLDRLHPAERQLLGAAAVLGRDVPVDMLEAVTGMCDLHLSDEAQSALAIIEHGRLQFAHALVRDAIRATLLPSDRKALHLAAAEWLAGRDPLLAASQFEAAGDARAAPAYAEAARLAMERHRADRALDHVARGLALASADADRVVLELLAARALLRLRRPEEAISAARRAAERATGEALVSARVLEADSLASIPKPAETIALVDEALGSLGPSEAPVARARLHAIRGNIHFLAGRLDACLADQQASRQWARAAGNAMAEAGAEVSLAWAEYQRGAFSTAVDLATTGLRLAEAGGFDRIRLAALRVRAVSRIFLLEHDAALADSEAAIALAADQGDWLNEVLARTTAGTVCLERLEAEPALAFALPALELADRLGGIGIEAAPLWVVGTAHGVLRDRAEGMRHLERARNAIGHRSQLRFALPRILGTLAWFVDPPARAALIEEGEAELARAPVAHSALSFWGSVMQASLTHGDAALGERCVAGILEHGGPTLPPWGAALISLAETWLPMLRPDPTPADVAAAEAYRQRCRAEPALAWHRPTMRAILDRRSSARAD
jgi:DNA-binding SARP family transcriptional activator